MQMFRTKSTINALESNPNHNDSNHSTTTSTSSSTTTSHLPKISVPRIHFHRASYIGASSLSARNVVIPASDMRIDTTVLGSGRLGSVFSGYWLEQPVVIKRILPSSEEIHNPGTRARLEQELSALLPHLSQPNILPLYGVCEQSDGSVWLVLKRGKRGSLKNVLHTYKNTNGTLPLTELFHIAKGILAAITYLHSHGIVYQDLRPGNILISGDGNPMLDPEFGVIRQVLQVITSQERLTAPKAASGSWVSDSAYLAPECFDSEEETTNSANPHVAQPTGLFTGTVGNSAVPRTLGARDIFSFAMVLFEMITGKPPFPQLRDLQVFLTLAKGERPDIPATVPVQIADLIKACWAQDPNQRPLPREALQSIVKAQHDLIGSSSGHNSPMATNGVIDNGNNQQIHRNSMTGSTIIAPSVTTVSDGTTSTATATLLSHPSATSSSGIPESQRTMGPSRPSIRNIFARE